MYEKSFLDASDDAADGMSLDVAELDVKVVERRGAERSIQLNSPAWICRRAAETVSERCTHWQQPGRAQTHLGNGLDVVLVGDVLALPVGAGRHAPGAARASESRRRRQTASCGRGGWNRERARKLVVSRSSGRLG